MINSISRIIGNNKTVVVNFSYLSLLQVFNLLLPLVTYPYLIRVLGVGVYGRVLFAQAVVMYFSILINFGFNISATKDVAESREDKMKLNEIVSSIFILKTGLWLLSLFFFLIVICLVPSFKHDVLLLIVTFGITLMELLFPQWYFLGVEKMRYITLINVFARSLFTALIFVFVNNPRDYLLVPLFNVVGFLFSGIISFFVLYRYERVVIKMQSVKILWFYLKGSFPLFLSSASIQVYVNANRVIIGSFLGMHEVAYYDLGEKVLKLLKIPVGMLGQAAFPKLSREKNISIINRYLFLGVCLTALLILLIVGLRRYVVYWLVGEYVKEAIMVLAILSISALMVAFSQFLGTSRMIVFGYKKAFSSIIASSAFVFIFGFWFLYSIGAISLYSLAWLAVAVEAWVTFAMFVFCYRKNLLV